MVTREHVLDAAVNLHPHIRTTPFLDSRYFGHQTGAQVWLLLETLQRTGSYKIRGAWNALRQLTPPERCRGVITASAGNHAQGVALAAEWCDCRATIVMPETAPLSKITQTRSYGEPCIILHGANYDEAAAHAQQVEKETAAVYVHPFDDEAVIAGQGTIGLHILQRHPDVDAIIVPVGGGGLIAGICAAVKETHPKVKVIGVNAAGAAAGVRSLETGRRVRLEHVDTVADGIKVKQLGEQCFEIISHYADRIVEVSDDQICEAVMHLFEKPKLNVEPAGAVGIAALMSGQVQLAKKKVVIILTGANIDPTLMQRIIIRGLRSTGRLTTVEIVGTTDTHSLQRVYVLLAETRAEVLTSSLQRDQPGMSLQQATCTLELQTRDGAHVEEVIQTLTGNGFKCTKL